MEMWVRMKCKRGWGKEEKSEAVGCVGGGYEGQCGISFGEFWLKAKSRNVSV